MGILAGMIQEYDEPILKYLSNVKVKFSAEPMVSVTLLAVKMHEYKIISLGRGAPDAVIY